MEETVLLPAPSDLPSFTFIVRKHFFKRANLEFLRQSKLALRTDLNFIHIEGYHFRERSLTSQCLNGLTRRSIWKTR